MSVIEAAKRLGISRALGYEAARTGAFPVKRIGRRLIVPIAAFEQWLNERDAA